MTKGKFTSNLNGAVDASIGLTKRFCHNPFSTNYKFIIRPNIEKIDSHLNQEEIVFHNKLLKLKGKYISSSDAIDLLSINGKVPLWINTSVLQSNEDCTTIELLTSRRLRSEEELNKVADQFPPFHILVSLPPNHSGEEKFDINWNRAKKNIGFWKSLKRISVQ